MNDFERTLADWLRRDTPEPPRMLTAERVLAGHAAAPRDRRNSRWAPLFALAGVAVLVIAVVVVVASVRDGRNPAPVATGPASPSASIRPSSPAPSGPAGAAVAAPPADFAATRLPGSSGLTAWKLTDAVSVTTDAGDHRQHIALPAGVAPAAVGLLSASADGTAWLAVVTGQTIDLYRHAAGGSWTRATLAPYHPAALNLGGAPPVVSSIEAHNGLVAVVAGWGLSATGAYTDLFLSTDNGARFTQHPTNAGMQVWWTRFLDTRRGLLVAGPNHNVLFRTADGGATWTRVGVPFDGSGLLGDPTVSPAGVVLPLAVTGPDGSADVTVEVSTDGGVSFHPTATALHVPAAANGGDLLPAVHGADVWVPASGLIYESGDQGRTWTTVTLSQPINDLSLGSPVEAIAQGSAQCASGDCQTTNFLIRTLDGGRTWTSM